MESYGQRKSPLFLGMTQPIEHEPANVIVCERVIGHLSLPSVLDQFQISQEAKLMGHCRPTPSNDARKIAHAQFFLRERIQEFHARGIGQQLKDPGQALKAFVAAGSAQQPADLLLVNVVDITRIILPGASWDRLRRDGAFRYHGAITIKCTDLQLKYASWPGGRQRAGILDRSAARSGAQTLSPSDYAPMREIKNNH